MSSRADGKNQKFFRVRARSTSVPICLSFSSLSDVFHAFYASSCPLDRTILVSMWSWKSDKDSGASSEPAAASQVTDQPEASSSSTPPPPSTSSSSTPSARLSAAWRAATARVSPGDPIPPRPPQLGEWASNTVLCAGAGAAFCGWREAATGEVVGTSTTAAATAGGAAAANSSKASSAALARAIAEEKTRRLVRIGSEAIRWV